jgi:hypothetical protein
MTNTAEQFSPESQCLWQHQLRQTCINSGRHIAMAINIYGSLIQNLFRLLTFWKICKNHNLERTANEFWDAEFESYLIYENPCMLFITITTQGPQIWTFYHDYDITYLKNTWKWGEDVSVKGVHRTPRNYPMLFLTSQMLTETWYAPDVGFIWTAPYNTRLKNPHVLKLRMIRRALKMNIAPTQNNNQVGTWKSQSCSSATHTML